MNKVPEWLVTDFLRLNQVFMKRLDQLKQLYGSEWYRWSVDDELLKDLERKIQGADRITWDEIRLGHKWHFTIFRQSKNDESKYIKVYKKVEQRRLENLFAIPTVNNSVTVRTKFSPK